jgi:hypothetical protein
MRNMFASISYHFQQMDFEQLDTGTDMGENDNKIKRQISKDDLRGQVKYFQTQD